MSSQAKQPFAIKDDIFTNISGTKTWVNDKESNRPESITIKLLKDGEVYRTTTTNAEKDWKYSFTKVPIYNADETDFVFVILFSSTIVGVIDSTLYP